MEAKEMPEKVAATALRVLEEDYAGGVEVAVITMPRQVFLAFATDVARLSAKLAWESAYEYGVEDERLSAMDETYNPARVNPYEDKDKK